MLQLRAQTHEYLKDGIPVPGVSQILREAGLVDLSHVPEDTLKRAQRFGSAGHRATELFDLKNLKEETLDPALSPYVEGWKKFLRETGFIVEAVEEPVFSNKYWYAGRLDRRGLLYGVRTVVDIKFTASMEPVTAIQLAAYQEAYNEGKRPQDKIKNRAIVQLKANGSYALPSKDFFQKSDFSVFFAALTLRNWRLKNKRGAKWKTLKL